MKLIRFFRMQIFRGYMKLKETRSRVKEGQKFERDKITDILAAFHIFDAQNRGYIESRDLREALGLTVKDIRCDELRQMLKETGLLVDRKITFAEFTCLMTDSSGVF
ncbi:hypothetical protein OS493_005488 [Desmophyllum pertusum]|uniref:EF-hand domain-containing protein n=1 Tax=Desmophyllum pertusum TaxID=174260 RepID=A0A9X0CMI0_9CNID|nr:hypothetical protein OS493_005488 [Desmophyllum pertusum]